MKLKGQILVVTESERTERNHKQSELVRSHKFTHSVRVQSDTKIKESSHTEHK